MDIKAARLAANMSQAHLAKAAGVSRRTIVRAEAGNFLSAETTRCLMAVLDEDAETVIEDSAAHGPARLVAMGWIDDSAADSLSHAAKFALKQFGHYEALYVGVIPYRGGYIWEAQEGGGGQGHLEQAVKALDGEGGWFVTAHRVFTVTHRDGLPTFMLHSGIRPPDVTGMRDLRSGGSRLRIIRAPFDPLRPVAHRGVFETCACGAAKGWMPPKMRANAASA